MNKRILISLSVIAAVAAIAIGGTVAYFSDTETSTGNTFTAGSIDLKVDNHCWYNGKECKLAADNKYHWNGDVQEPLCTCTWELKDLTEGDLFFNFTDLKPGDNGEDTVSLRVNNNDAWACVTFKNLKNDDNTCTEPEDADDLPQQTGCWATSSAGEGELAQNLYFVFWADVCDHANQYPNAYPGDNIYQPGCDTLLMQGPASDILNGRTYPIADKTFSIVPGGGPLKGSTTYYIGKAWCFGEYGGQGDGHLINCDGADVNNASQSDSLTGDIEFYAVQARNNPNFTCSPR